MWKECLELASKLLAPGGYFLQYDTDKYGGFGETEMMQSFIEANSLNLDLDHCSEPIDYGDERRQQWGRLVLILWRKA